MPLSTDVKLPKDHPPLFADRCVVCGRLEPGSTVRLMTGSIGWWTWMLWTFGRPFVVKAPACPRCSWLLHLRRLIGLLLTVVLLYLAFWHLWPLVQEHIGGAGRRWVMLLLGFACLAPLILFEVVFPHPFNITAFSDTVDYEFSDAEMAYEFADLNADAAHIEVS